MHAMTVSYPVAEDATFDYEYYQARHLPLCAELFSQHGYRGCIFRSGASAAPAGEAREFASVDLLFESLDAMRAGIAASGKAVSSDIPNFTNAKPRIMFSEIVVSQS